MLVSSASCCLVGLQLTLSVWVKVMHNVSLLFVCPYYCTHNRTHTLNNQADILSHIRVIFYWKVEMEYWCHQQHHPLWNASSTKWTNPHIYTWHQKSVSPFNTKSAMYLQGPWAYELFSKCTKRTANYSIVNPRASAGSLGRMKYFSWDTRLR